MESPIFQLPQIKTIIVSKPGSTEISSVDRSVLMPTSNLDAGYNLDFNLSEVEFGLGAGAKGKARKLPMSYKEAFAVLNLIEAGHTGKNNNYFDGDQLKTIAHNLGLKRTSDKESQAKVIRDAVLAHFSRKK